MVIDLIKCHGSGNDFLMMDEMGGNYGFTEGSRANLAKNLCNRKTSLGADGILYILNSETADARMRVFNSDGSEASMCGNGLRCVARYVCEKLGIEEAIIETMKADLQVKKAANIFPGVPTYQVEISPVSFRVEDLPLNIKQKELIQGVIPALSEELTFTALAVPNPHLITIVDDTHLKSNLQKELSEGVNAPNELFPDGVNVSFIKLIEKNKIYVRTYERGVGFTNACGTAMSASSLVTTLIGENDVEDIIEVYNNGGMVRCIVHKDHKDYTIDLIGNATYLYKVTLDSETNAVVEKHDTIEEESYQKLEEHAKSVLRG
ncbi:diaminopimelate epimerase [Bacillus sp. B15-48]|uniref:diaminopimelate epimerase n=1 Tax=Bacillus sp. B15-48 TaxID=1548601 RepID=UPI00193F7161|nr:diaminopimelate epimerase [Bacillus sp. B15-48]MBM4761988.1 diaminopimelate epimerase [Bacillus sp. B15-48]